jgi:hypothetical protein
MNRKQENTVEPQRKPALPGESETGIGISTGIGMGAGVGAALEEAEQYRSRPKDDHA